VTSKNLSEIVPSSGGQINQISFSNLRDPFRFPKISLESHLFPAPKLPDAQSPFQPNRFLIPHELRCCTHPEAPVSDPTVWFSHGLEVHLECKPAATSYRFRDLGQPGSISFCRSRHKPSNPGRVSHRTLRLFRVVCLKHALLGQVLKICLTIAWKLLPTRELGVDLGQTAYKFELISLC
jgi:hypothetical protein